MHMRGVLGSIDVDEDVADLFPTDGQPAEAPWRLALVTVMHCVENLSDEQAASAVPGRIDGKYLLGLELTDVGCDASILSECRDRVIKHHAEERLLENMLTMFGHKGWLKARGRQRTAFTHVLGKIRALHRVVCGKPCVLRSKASRWWLPIGCVLRASTSGCLWEKRNERHWPKRLASREERSWMPFLIPPHLSGSGRFRL